MKFGKTIPAIACTLSLALGLTGYEAAAAPYAEPPAASEASERTDAESLIMAAETEEAEDTATGNSADASDRRRFVPRTTRLRMRIYSPPRTSIPPWRQTLSSSLKTTRF